MSMESELQRSVSKWRSDDDKAGVSRKESRLSYNRAFLLSFCDLDTCKRLPSGFDLSIFRELEEASNCFSQSKGDSDSGSWNATLSRHSLRNPESGFLGSGGILKEPECAAGDSSALFRGGSCNSLNRNVALYRPPHLCKMNLHIRRENKHLCSDETFGSSRCFSFEGAYEERRKGSSFGLTSKDQNAIEEKQKNIPEVQKENLDPDTTAILKLSDARVEQTKKNEYEEKPADSISVGKDEGLHYQGREKLEIDPVSGLDGKVDANDEICWPDEDSLITVDDFIFPDDIKSVPDGCSTEAGLFASTTPIDFARRVADLGVKPYGEKSRPPLENESSIFVPEDTMGIRTYNDCGFLTVERPYLQVGHSQNIPSPGRIATKPCGSSKVVPSELKAYPFHPLRYPLPANLLHNPGHDLYAQSIRFDNPVLDPLSLQMPIPGEISYYLNRLHLPVTENAPYLRGQGQKRHH